LAELGFHWNNTRQAWQHPCGQFSTGSRQDPRQKYQSYFPEDSQQYDSVLSVFSCSKTAQFKDHNIT
jgi:hypothetical protein